MCTQNYGSYGSPDAAKRACSSDPECVGVYDWKCDDGDIKSVKVLLKQHLINILKYHHVGLKK